MAVLKRSYGYSKVDKEDPDEINSSTSSVLDIQRAGESGFQEKTIVHTNQTV
ncbi:hypothetical protein F3Y22_tig00112762pilonHSYRG00040 [Hibiscus syriacus]|uniref:Uncharacterized protein n=1 Tax=Hibiscus syriacus TaxID=106335 RepID=A0A6A2XR53_HIBSY|nr:hypothetical protein F3Y22_tig00112762pilonHSYRG00040 [Hibiscus syriacus]